MTIKTKLILNVITVILIVAAVAATSIIGMGSVSNRLHYLTERSTPFQMRTVEFQRAIQGATADLIKVGASRDRNEFKAARAEAEKSLAEVATDQGALQALAGESIITAYDQLNSIARELFSVTDGRLTADEDAVNADRVITEKMREASARLKELDSKIKGLQVTAASSYTRSMDDTRNVSARVRNVEALKLTLKDFQLGFLEAAKAQNRKTVLIAQGKCNSAMNKALQNELLKTSPSIAADIRQMSIKVPEYLKAHSAIVGQAGADTTLRDGLAAEVTDKLSAVILAVEQEGAMASDSFSSETRKQSSFFGNSTLATAILASNSELLSLGLSIEGLSSRLFNVSSAKELDLIEAELKRDFSRSTVVRNDLARSLAKLNARKEAVILRNTEGALASINNLLFVKDGIISKIRGRLEMDAKAAAATGKLRDIVLKQAEKGKQTVSVAQGEQEKAIATVNRMVKFSTLLIAAISAGAVLFGIIFGFWIYRSIAGPLTQLINASGKVSEGDLACILATDRKDEIGRVETAMAAMVANLRDMVGKIRVATENLASSSEELSATAGAMEVGSREQTMQIEQSATAMTQMSQTTEEVARNSGDTSEAAVNMKKVAEEGREAMHGTMQELEHFAETVRESAKKVEVVGTQSEKINDIVALIKDIADQTNLLALNAAIEAARAGEQGRGFAVVADSVRQLAVRTTEATSEIGATIREMEASIGDSVSYMQEERESVSKVVQHVKNTLGNIDAIVTYVEQVTDMVQRTAVAAEEQSASTGEVSRTMERISAITHELQSSFSDVRNSSSDLSRLAVELNGMVGWFRV